MTKEEAVDKAIELEFGSGNAKSIRAHNSSLVKVAEHLYDLMQPSLPSDLDEAAHRYAWEKQEHHIDFDGNEYLDYGPRYDAFKAGAEWMAGQGVSMLGKVGIYGVDVESITKELREAGFNLGEEIILQIRKK